MLNLKKDEIRNPNTNVPITCAVEENTRIFPNAASSETRISSPTIKRSRVTPSSDKVCKNSLFGEPKTGKAAIKIPVRIYAKISGCLKNLKIKENTEAITIIIVKSKKILPINYL